MNASKRRMLLWIMLSTMLSSGCSHVRLNNADRLTRRSDFPAAAQAAPEWCRDALKTINSLEFEIERR